jgi:purine nucleosidase
MNKKRVIIDTDPGVDDINAILFAFLSDQFEIEAITTVHGNVDVETCTKNALYLVEHFSRRNIPVYRGSALSIRGGPIRESTILHGKDGMGNTGLARPTINRQPESAVTALIRMVTSAPGEITLLVLGPQTNIALAIRSEPDFASAVKEIIFMGGRISPRADTNPFVTFNIGEDPEAAHIVIQETNIPITMLGQEVAMKVKFDPARLERFERLHTKAGKYAATVTRFYVNQQMSIMGQTAGAIPDISVIAYALRPDLFNQRYLRVDVDITDGPMRGATVCGSLPYFRIDSLEEYLKNRPDIDDDLPKSTSPNQESIPAQAGRTINVPSQIDARLIEDWYEELLAKQEGYYGRN